MNQRTILKNSLSSDQIKNRKLQTQYFEHESIFLSFSQSEFFHRQQLYDELYKSNHCRRGHLKSDITQIEIKRSRFKEVIESAKQKFASSPNYLKNNIIHKQQSSISEIAQQLRKERSANLAQLKNSDKNLKKINQLNLNYFLIIALSVLCYLVVLFEMIRPDTPNSK
ncbi:unnamed protein product [Paramecium pentaurelia]|uniref:Transmembrane protein n=1 Tax=Paramecium pentaurelia TaxID=43138 RepID=A0A8S1X4F1_9CILI|nr:unnamed protein product [Paramecium pentaurelia]